MHIYLYSFDKQNPMAADAKLERQLEKGDYEVLGIDGVDEAAGTVFFAANKDDPRQEHMYSVKLDGSGLKALTPEEGMHSAKFQRRWKALYADCISARRRRRRLRSARWGEPATGVEGAGRDRGVRVARAKISRVQGRRWNDALRPLAASSGRARRAERFR